MQGQFKKEILHLAKILTKKSEKRAKIMRCPLSQVPTHHFRNRESEQEGIES